MAERQHHLTNNNTSNDVLRNIVENVVELNKSYLGLAGGIIEELETSKAHLEQQVGDNADAPFNDAMLRQKLRDTTEVVEEFLKGVVSAQALIPQSEFRVPITRDQNLAKITAGITETANVFENCDNEMLLNKQIVHHLKHSNMVDVAQSLADESGLCQEEAEAAQRLTERDVKFQNFRHISDEIKAQNMEPAIEWFSKQTEPKSIFFKNLLVFMKMLKTQEFKDIEAQIAFLREYIKPLAKDEAQINMMNNMANLWIYADAKVNNPPNTLMQDNLQKFYHDLAAAVFQHICTAEHVPLNSPLETVMFASISVIPNYFLGEDITTPLNSLVRDAKIGQCHSKFECPILKEMTTEENPSVVLSCQHMISNQAAIGMRVVSTIECPFCKEITNVSDMKTAYF